MERTAHSADSVFMRGAVPGGCRSLGALGNEKQALHGIDRMGLPAAQEARPFYRAGKQRFEDARLLLEKAERTTGAIYLAGYGIECLLKALVLSVVSAGDRQDMVANFRGARAHNYDWLKARYFENGGAPFPSEISKAFALVNTWDTEWRYRSGTASRREAEGFLRAAEQILMWADGRL